MIDWLSTKSPQHRKSCDRLLMASIETIGLLSNNQDNRDTFILVTYMVVVMVTMTDLGFLRWDSHYRDMNWHYSKDYSYGKGHPQRPSGGGGGDYATILRDSVSVSPMHKSLFYAVSSNRLLYIWVITIFLAPLSFAHFWKDWTISDYRVSVTVYDVCAPAHVKGQI